MSKVFIISDLHFGHENLARHRGFENADEQDELIIKNWNSVVGKNDMTWILGDIGMEKCTHYHLLDRLNGRKRVILGNHDSPKLVPELLRYVENVGSMVKYKGYLLTHCPIHPHEMERFNVNIHGHLHEENIDDDRYINVSCEQLNYTPMEFPRKIKSTRIDSIKENIRNEKSNSSEGHTVL